MARTLIAFALFMMVAAATASAAPQKKTVYVALTTGKITVPLPESYKQPSFRVSKVDAG